MRAFSPDARLGRWFVQQRERSRHKADRIVERYRRRVKELDPRPTIEDRGVPQSWHRDTPHQQSEEYDA